MGEVYTNIVDESTGFSPKDHHESSQEGEIYDADGVLREKGFSFASKDVCDGQENTKRGKEEFSFVLTRLKDQGGGI